MTEVGCEHGERPVGVDGDELVAERVEVLDQRQKQRAMPAREHRQAVVGVRHMVGLRVRVGRGLLREDEAHAAAEHVAGDDLGERLGEKPAEGVALLQPPAQLVPEGVVGALAVQAGRSAQARHPEVRAQRARHPAHDLPHGGGQARGPHAPRHALAQRE
ncbi:MAG: hypothetical protein M5R40_25925 [Anaerolineae bacterium]|nr:hypothetical protein [Anaerolineae bacterium]